MDSFDHNKYFDNELKNKEIGSIYDLHGSWLEFNKPQDMIIAFLQRLGINGIKRRFIARTNCKLEISISDQKKKKEILNNNSNKKINQSTIDTTPKIFDVDDSKELETTVTPSTDFLNFNQSNIESNFENTRWMMRQYFPGNRIFEMEFVTDGKSLATFVDSETGKWNCLAKIVDNILFCKRINEDHGVTLYETRAIIETPDEFKDCTESKIVQNFFWYLEDHEDSSKNIQCNFYLLPA